MLTQEMREILMIIPEYCKAIEGTCRECKYAARNGWVCPLSDQRVEAPEKAEQ